MNIPITGNDGGSGEDIGYMTDPTEDIELSSFQMPPELVRRVNDAMLEHAEKPICVGLMPPQFMLFMTITIYGWVYGNLKGQSRMESFHLISALMLAAGSLDSAFQEYLRETMTQMQDERARKQSAAEAARAAQNKPRRPSLFVRLLAAWKVVRG